MQGHFWKVLHESKGAIDLNHWFDITFAELSRLAGIEDSHAKDKGNVRLNFAEIQGEVVSYDLCSEEFPCEMYSRTYGDENLEYLGFGKWHHQEVLDLEAMVR